MTLRLILLAGGLVILSSSAGCIYPYPAYGYGYRRHAPYEQPRYYEHPRYHEHRRRY